MYIYIRKGGNNTTPRGGSSLGCREEDTDRGWDEAEACTRPGAEGRKLAVAQELCFALFYNPSRSLSPIRLMMISDEMSE